MKKAVLLLLVLSAGHELVAQPQGRPQLREEMKKRLDTDGDGIVSEAERDAFKNRRNQKGHQPGRFEHGGDETGRGKRLKDVMQRLKKEDEGKFKELVEKFDLNDDGSLDDREMGIMQGEKAIRRILMEKFDKNRNGKIDEDEKAALMQDHEMHMENFSRMNPAFFHEVLQSFDKNANKKLDFDEWTKALRAGVIPVPPPPGRHQQPGMPPSPPSGMHGMPGMPPGAPGGHPGMRPEMRPEMPSAMNGQQPPQHHHVSQHPQSAGYDDGGLLEGVKIGDSSEALEPDQTEDDLDFLDF